MTWRTRNALGTGAGRLLAAGLAAISCWACGGAPALAPGEALEGRLEPGESAAYRIDAGAGEYVRVAIEPVDAEIGSGLDARVVGPRGEPVLEASGIRDAAGGVLAWLGAGEGRHRLELTDPGSPEGLGYRVTLAELRPARNDDADRVAAQTARSEAFRRYSAGDAEAARAALGRELEHWRGVSGSAAAQAESLIDLAELERQSDPERALARCEEAIRVSEGAGLGSWRMQALNSKGRLLRARRDCAGALEAYRQAHDTALGEGDLSWAGNVSYNVGRLHLDCSSREEAEEAFREAIELGRRAGDAGLQAVGHRELAVLARQAMDHGAAADHLDRAWELVQRSDDVEAMADVVYERANLARSQGRLGEARESFLRSLELNQAPGREGLVVDVLLSLGALSLDLRRVEEAREYFRRARDRAEALEDLPGLVRAQTELGAVEQRSRDLPAAEEMYRQALAAAERLPPGAERQELTAAADFRLGNVLLLQGRAAEAIPLLEQALALQRERGDRRAEAFTRSVLGTAWALSGDTSTATAHLTEALASDREAGDPIAVAWTLYRLAEALRDVDPGRARVLIEQGIETIEGVRSGLLVDTLRAEFADGPRRLYDLYVDLLVSNGESRSAFLASERGRARALLDLLAEARIDLRAGVDPSLAEAGSELQERMSWLRNELGATVAEGAAHDRVANLQKRLVAAEREWWQVEAAIRRASPRYQELVAPSVVGLERLQSSLPPGRVLLEYWLGRKRAWVFVVTRDSFEVVPLPPTEELLPLISRFRSAIVERHPPQALAQPAHELYRALVAPAIAGGGLPAELIVVPDGPLHLVPFEALVVSVARARARFDELEYLVHGAAISYAPSATVLASLGPGRRRTPAVSSSPSPPALVAFADPTYDRPLVLDCSPREAVGGDVERDRVRSGGSRASALLGRSLEPLEGSRAEVRAIAARHRGAVRIFEGSQASESTVKRSPELANAERVHFAVHGIVCEAFPERSALVFSLDDDPVEDGLLQTREIFDLDLAADLVVLSACDSGTGKLVSGEGVIGLARAFFYAGTPSAVVSLWPVSDRSTAELMVGFYARLDAGDDKAEALRQARRELIASGGRHSAPFYWAPFVLLGSREVR